MTPGADNRGMATAVELEQKPAVGYWSVMGARPCDAFLCLGCHAPATITCHADVTALCSAYDDDIHSANPLVRRHERLPIAPFFGVLTDVP